MEEIVIDHQCLLGEGPVWDVNLKSICWVDILLGKIHEYTPGTKSHKTISVNQMIGAVAICKSGHFVGALKNGFGFIDRKSGAVSMIANPEPHLPGNRFNDGKCDPQGRFWAGTMSHTDEPKKGSLYLLDKNLTVTEKIKKVSTSNGLAWSNNHGILYYIDSPTQKVVAYNFDKKSGEIKNKRTIVELSKNEGCPDGMTIDGEGMLWIAHWDGWQISRWNPDTGKKIKKIPLPVSRVTSCCFGGENFEDLYITSAKIGLNSDQLKSQPLAGSLFVIKNIGVKGVPAFVFDV